MFENKVLKRIFGSKRKEITGRWNKLHNVELYNLYSSHNIFRVFKSKKMRLVGHISSIFQKISFICTLKDSLGVFIFN
jgi:hypothetical protein